MTDLEKAVDELVNALDLIKGNKLFNKRLVIEAALIKYAKQYSKKERLNFAEHCMLKLLSTKKSEDDIPEIATLDLKRIKLLLEEYK